MWAAMGLKSMPKELVDKLLSGTDVVPMNFELSPVKLSEGFRLIGDLYVDGNSVGQMERIFTPATHMVDHAYLGFDKDYRGGGRGARILANSVREWREAGILGITIRAGADNGGYTWARAGFLPTQDSWDECRGRLPLLAREARAEGRITTATRDAIIRLAGDPHPESLWDIADLPKKASKPVLSQTQWNGTLIFDSEPMMKRLGGFIQRNVR